MCIGRLGEWKWMFEEICIGAFRYEGKTNWIVWRRNNNEINHLKSCELET